VQELPSLLGAAADWLDADLSEAVLDAGLVDRFRRLGREAVHDLARRARGGEKQHPGRRLDRRPSGLGDGRHLGRALDALRGEHGERADLAAPHMRHQRARYVDEDLDIDRKSTRLNSSHEWISYAVFCL